ncbi:heterodisulfide reductase [candidate division WOR-3 bacterium]|uniref:Heterodisulfide reductase n=1 Tax=candidate division WOR-3 bacterium TaxID=2052148 RepID=A0A9D5QDF6_UNCW3|nr:heterodisulfide reductase [candidate division WOR-3 bacterium]MBD3365006.1 heterodisulfide reductase [candidate division WOR-3 bacterium]
MISKTEITAKNEAFLRRITELSGVSITRCEQCGICSVACPLVSGMDISPAEMMRTVQLGQEEVTSTKTIWVCASCFTCTVRCPRGLDPSKVAEALRQIELRKAIDYMDISTIPAEEMRQLPQIALVSAFRKLTG